MIRLLILPTATLLLGFIFTAPVSNSIAEKNNYPEHLAGAFTGGFGEETCRSCHFDYDLNPDGGSISVSGIPAELPVDEPIEITITVEREDMGAAGFQISARYEDGSQAGKFDIGDNGRIIFSGAVPDSLQYVQHSNEGTNPSAENKNSWMVRWEAPKSLTGPIIFNIASNAANGDQSEFGDYIYAKELNIP